MAHELVELPSGSSLQPGGRPGADAVPVGTPAARSSLSFMPAAVCLCLLLCSPETPQLGIGTLRPAGRDWPLRPFPDFSRKGWAGLLATQSMY